MSRKKRQQGPRHRPRKSSRDVSASREDTRFDRAHFAKYGDFALVYEIVYYVKKPDYNVYMDIQQAINLEINRRFTEQEIEFAYPTQTIYVERPGAPGTSQEH